MMQRRGFLLGLGAALSAPAVVKAESLMKIAVLRRDLDVAYSSGGPVSLADIRDLLFPGLQSVVMSYTQIEPQWNKVFEGHEARVV